MEVIAILFLIVAGCAKGLMDTLQFHYGNSIVSTFKNQHWWNPKESWKNKYRDIGKTKIANLIEYLDNTVLVWTTDAWHFFQFIFLGGMFAAIITYQPIIGYWWADLIAFRLIFGLAFRLFYIKKKKKNV